MPKRAFDEQAAINRLAKSLGNNLAESVPAWVFAEADGNTNAQAKSGRPNTIYIRFDLSSNERTYAYYDVTLNSQLFLDGLAIKVRPYYRNRPGDKREWVMVGSDEIMAGIQFGSTPPDPAAGFGGLAAHTHQTSLQGGLLNAGLIFNAGAVSALYGGTGLSTISAGGLIYGGAGGGYFLPLAIGAGNQVLTVSGGYPAWINNNASFLVASDSGTSPLTISNGDTFTLAGGLGITSVGSLTDTVTFNLDVPVSVTLGGTAANLSATGAATHFVRQASTGAAFTVGAIVSADLTTALLTPPAIGTTTAAAGRFTAITLTGTGGTSHVLKQLSAGGAVTSGVITSADIATALTTPGAIGATTPSTGAFTGLVTAQRTVTGNTTLTSADYTVFCDATAGNITVTLPAVASHAGRIYNVKKIDASANTVTIDGNASETIDGALTQVISVQYASLSLQTTTTQWWLI